MLHFSMKTNELKENQIKQEVKLISQREQKKHNLMLKVTKKTLYLEVQKFYFWNICGDFLIF